MIHLLLLFSIIATSDGEYLQIQVPPNWSHVLVVVEPTAGFHEIVPHVFMGYTTATSGVVHGVICTDDRCEMVEESFDSAVLVPGMRYAKLTPWRLVQCTVLFLASAAAFYMFAHITFVRGW